MIEKQTTPLYEKCGRKYVPVHARWYEDHNIEQMPVGTFKMIYAYQDGGRAYEYKVTPDTAGMMAAMMIARKAMEQAIHEKSRMRPSALQPYTKKQLAAIERFKAEMGGMFPSHWTENSAYEISEAAMKAVLEYRP